MKKNYLQFCLLLLMLLGFAVPRVRAIQLNGTYTIDSSMAASTTNFKNFTSAVAYLTGVGTRNDGGINNVAPFGVSGTVSFIVAAGTYSEQVNIVGPIAGASMNNKIIFDGIDPLSRILEFTSTLNNSRHVLKIQSSPHIILKNITIQNKGTGTGWGVHLTGSGIDSIQIKKCIIKILGGIASTGSGFAGIVLSASTTSYSANQCSGGNTGVTDHPFPEQIDHPKIWRKVVNLIGEV